MNRRAAHGPPLRIGERMLHGIVEAIPVAQFIAVVVEGLVALTVLDHDLGLHCVLGADAVDQGA